MGKEAGAINNRVTMPGRIRLATYIGRGQEIVLLAIKGAEA
ncbi:MAG TPA: hypothetical protein VFQ92_06855 [Blastocatellia bacterium]|nr:hypothetical protein [Blastocatellia bacterium]